MRPHEVSECVCVCVGVCVCVCVCVWADVFLVVVLRIEEFGFVFSNYTQATKAIEILGCARLLYYALGTARHTLFDAGDGRVDAS